MAAVADFNQDGNLDIVVPGAQGNDNSDPITIFFWDIVNNNVLIFNDMDDWGFGAGRVNIADVDGDGQLNATYVSGQKLYSLKEDMTLLWSKGITEGSSGVTGCSVFDFNDDDAAEVLYRSEAQMFIIDGLDGSTRNSILCKSRTAWEYPIVADVDGDGASEICLSCSGDESLSTSNYYNAEYGQIRVYQSDGENWQPSRSVWNQHAYYNVNVNDDLTIPITQQNHSVIFSTNVCTNGPNRPLNIKTLLLTISQKKIVIGSLLSLP